VTNFCHLHVHNEHSLLDGIGTADQYCARARELGQTHLSITNHGNVDGLIKFQKSCKKHGITPVMGCELYIVPDLYVKAQGEKRHHITALIQNEIGFKNLLQMLSQANLEGFYHRPRIDPNLLLTHREGLVFMSACIQSFVFMPDGLELLMELSKTNPVCLEVMPHNIEAQRQTNLAKLRLSQQTGIPLVATNDCHYVLPHQTRTQEVLLAIQRGAKWTDPDRWRFGFDGLHLRSEQEMAQAFVTQGVLPEDEWRQAMSNTMEIARMCSGFEIKKLDVSLPKASGYEDRDETQLLTEIIQEGMKIRIGNTVPQEYITRTAEEFELICQQGFQRYFLIIWEIVQWCREQGIMTGPGRGSVGGSLVAYLMGLTDVDPIRYGLIFARFISPERIDYPDIDMDFEKERREEVRAHIEACYGHHNVASITTFLTMKGRAAIRDVARVFSVPQHEVDGAAKSIQDKPDGDNRAGHTIEDSLVQSQDLQAFRFRHPDVIQLAMELEGQARGYGKHAAGICISADDLRLGERCNLAVRDNVITANWDKGDGEYMGLMKFDVLGLSTLSVLNYTRKLIKQNCDIDIDYDRIPLDDQTVFQETAQGHCVGGFQLGTNLLIRLAKDLQVREFNDLVLINALSRPGPLGAGITDDFIARRRGQKPITYIHPRMEQYTRETLGLIIYQEQVMWTMNELAGLSWGVCDKVRKVMGKSKGAAEFLKFEPQFVDGCLSQKTLGPQEAKHIWAQLSTCGSYLFNKAHAVEYSLIGYWTLWLKFNHPKEFMAALLTYGDERHKASHVAEAKRLGLRLVLPRIGLSEAKKWMPDRSQPVLYAPFTEIKGIGPTQAEKLVKGTNSSKPSGKTKKQTKPIRKGFFDTDLDIDPTPQQPATAVRAGNAIQDILHKVGADGRALTTDELQQAQQYFDFNIQDSAGRFSKIIQMDPGLAMAQESDLLGCNISANLIRITRHVHPVIECRACQLRDECRAPVNPSFGRYNIMATGEAPGPDEDEQGIGFIGRAGTDILWPEMRKHGLDALMLHVTNVCKCWPSRTKTPGKKHIEACRPILDAEIKCLQPIVILAFGNVGNQFFAGKSSGISGLSGTTEWSDRYQCWVCWCTHPSAVLHNRSNMESFSTGIANFAQVLARLGGQNVGTGQVPQVQVCPYNGRFGLDNNNFLECGPCPIWNDCAVAASYGDWMK